MTEHSPRRRRRPTPRGFWSLLRSPSGMLDLGSVTVGVVVVALLSLGTAAMVFGVIPWAQNNGSQQMLASVSSAQTVAVNKGGKFLDADGLVSGGFIQKITGIASGTNGQGDCFVTVSTSDSGKVFYNTNKATDPQELTATTKLSCVTGRELQNLVDASGATLAITPETYYAWGWGANDLGQSGTGDLATLTYKSPFAIPTTAMAAPAVITAVSAGTAHACAATVASKIYCWGGGSYYRTGQSTTATQADPIVVTDTLLAGKDITALSSGYIHNCVVASAQAYCWGGNTWGQLGNGTVTHSGRTVLVAGLAGKTVTAVGAGHGSSCAAANNEAYCWGENSTGRLGNGSTTDSLVPVKLAGLLTGKTVSEVSVGRNHACAVASGAVYCWGENGSGQLGSGSTTDSLVPVKVTGLPAGKTVKGLSAGTAHNCVTADGTVYCWGGNSAGQLGNGTTVDAKSAVPVNGLLRGKVVTMVSAGLDDTTAGTNSHTCALAADTQYCWGFNGNGELGNGGTTSSSAPVKAGNTWRKMTAIAAGGEANVSVGVPIIP